MADTFLFGPLYSFRYSPLNLSLVARALVAFLPAPTSFLLLHLSLVAVFGFGLLLLGLHRPPLLLLHHHQTRFHLHWIGLSLIPIHYKTFQCCCCWSHRCCCYWSCHCCTANGNRIFHLNSCVSSVGNRPFRDLWTIWYSSARTLSTCPWTKEVS